MAPAGKVTDGATEWSWLRDGAAHNHHRVGMSCRPCGRGLAGCAWGRELGGTKR